MDNNEIKESAGLRLGALSGTIALRRKRLEETSIIEREQT